MHQNFPIFHGGPLWWWCGTYATGTQVNSQCLFITNIIIRIISLLIISTNYWGGRGVYVNAHAFQQPSFLYFRCQQIILQANKLNHWRLPGVLSKYMNKYDHWLQVLNPVYHITTGKTFFVGKYDWKNTMYWQVFPHGQPCQGINMRNHITCWGSYRTPLTIQEKAEQKIIEQDGE